MPDISGELGTASAGTTIPARAVGLSGWFGLAGDSDWLLVDNASRLYPWADYCGIPGGIPNRTTIYASLGVAGQSPSYAQSVTAAQITAAIAACPSNQVVYLYPGTYNLGSGRITWGLASGITLRGAGPGKTIINSTVDNVVNNGYYNYELGTAVSVTGGYTKGSMAIVLGSAPSANFAPGNLIAIIEDNSPDKFAAGIGTYSRDGLTSSIYALGTEASTRSFKYLSRVTSVVGNTVNIASPLPFSFSPSLNIRAYPPNGTGTMNLCGIENMTFHACSDPVRLYITDRCWFKDVDFDACPDGDIGALQVNASFQFEMRRCYVHDSPGYPNQADGIGMSPNFGTCNGLFIDNIGYRTSAPFEINGASANAFVYNYSWDIARAAYAIPQVFPSLYHHGPLCSMNLYEGNIGGTFMADGYHGSDCYGMIFRNNLRGTHPTYVQERKMINLPRGSYYYSVIGNVLGDSSFNPTAYEPSGLNTFGHEQSYIYVLGYPNTGNSSGTPGMPWSTFSRSYPDTAVSSTLLRHGNYDYYNDAAVWDGGIASHSIPDSLLYSSKPSFFGSRPWPAIGPDLGTMVNDIPAKHRWDAYAISSNIDDLFADES